MSLLSSKQLSQLIQKDSFTVSDIDLFLSHIEPCLTLSERPQKQQWVTDIQSLFLSFLRQTSDLIDRVPGYNHFVMEHLIDYITKPTLFSFDLLKEKGKGILYGKAIILLRQSIVNTLPYTIRQHVVGKKLHYYGIIDALSKPLNKNISGYLTIDGIEDIGMTHSVYKLTIEGASYVLKSTDTDNLQCFLDLSHCVELDTFSTHFFNTKFGRWDLSTYLDSDTLSDYLHHNHPSEGLIRQLGYHAAFGDLIGRGDRHFENYIVSDNQLYAIDLSILFWENNEEWVFKYAKAGMTEFSVMACFMEDSALFQSQLDIFYSAYTEMIYRCRDKQTQLNTIIETYFPEPPLFESRIRFLRDRLTNLHYGRLQMQMYLKSLSIFLKRLPYKKLLQTIGDDHPTIIDNDPLLKMYQLSDRKRWSCFFLLDQFYRGHLLSRIHDSALEHHLIQENSMSSHNTKVDILIQDSLKQISLTE